jgi:hypothetical protein
MIDRCICGVGQIATAEPKWYSGEYRDASTGGQGNEIRVLTPRKITDVGGDSYCCLSSPNFAHGPCTLDRL